VDEFAQSVPESIDDRVAHVMGLIQVEAPRDEQGRFASTEEPAPEIAGDEALPDQGETAPVDPASGDEAETPTEQAEESAIVLPPGWSADKADAFKMLPPDVRDYITARESDRNKHFDRTAQETAAQRKAAETAAQAASAERQRYAQALDVVRQQIQQTAPKAPDPALAATDPAKYIAQKAQYDDAVTRYQATQAELQRVQAEEQEHQSAAFKQHLADQAQKLSEAIPEWSDEKKRAKDQQDIAKFLRDTGYGQEEIASVADSRAVVIARKAMLYDRLMAQKPGDKKVVAVPPPTTRPTATGTAPKTSTKLAALKQSALATDDLRTRAAYAVAALNTR
jgi:hypothetical protein